MEVRSLGGRVIALKVAFVQQDNAPAHVSADIYKVVGSGRKYGWDITIRAQPPNSPNFNILDLCFFRALQSATQNNDLKNIDNVLKHVKKEFDKMNPWTLNDVFLSLFTPMECAMAIDEVTSTRNRI